jgi:hygromycin-B 7''-O-kinase
MTMIEALPPSIGVAEFDALHDDVPRWRGIVAAIAARHGTAPFVPVEEGTALVGLIGRELVVKVYPPFLRDHFEFEVAALARLAGRLGVPTPEMVFHGEHDGWPYHVITQLDGEPLDRAWPALPEAGRCRVLESIGRLAAEVHALPVDGMAALAPDWGAFLAGQRARCVHRQQRTGLPAHLLAQVEAFVAGPVPDAGPSVILTGEYTPMNLLQRQGALSGMFDFGDGLVGPREYDWLGPLCFLAAGHRGRCEAFFAGYGEPAFRERRAELMRLLLLHRYSNLPAQLAFEGWDRAPGFEALAETLWP